MAPKPYWTPNLVFDALARWEKEHGSLPSSEDWKKTNPDRSFREHPSSRHVASMFGTWRNALDEYRRYRPKKRWRKWTREECIEAFQKWYEEEGKVPSWRDVGSPLQAGRLPSMTSIKKLFGTFSNLLEASGFKKLPTGVTYKSLSRFQPLPRKDDR